MKKSLLLLGLAGVLGATAPGNAQTLTTYDFESTTPPAIPAGWSQRLPSNPTVGTGWTSGDNTSQSSTYFTFPAHTKFICMNDDRDNANRLNDDTLILPGQNLTSPGGVFMSFDQYYFASSDGVSQEVFSLLASTDSGATWTVVTTFAGNTANAWQQSVADLSAYANQTNVRFAFRYFDGTTPSHDGNLYGVGVDNVRFYTPSSFDVANAGVATGNFIAQGNNDIKTLVKNLGSTTITSLNLYYQIDGGAPVASQVTGLNIAPLATATVTSTVPYNATIGTHTILTYTGTLNGSNGDTDPTNDTATKSVTVLTQLVQRKPLYEVFTSSTCPPCRPGNANFHAIVDTMNQDDFVAVKFQQDFPGTGDPYCTNETVNRRNYYAINSIPRMELDGGWDGNANSFTLALHQERRAEPAQYILNGTYGVDTVGHKVYVKVFYTPLFTTSGNKMYVSIIEDSTRRNLKTNGETRFYQVSKKMLPNENGLPITTRAAGTYDSMSYSYGFPGNYRLPANGQATTRIKLAQENSVEQYKNLRVIAWIQSGSGDKKVYQAANLTPVNVAQSATNVLTTGQSVRDFAIYPNPAKDMARLNINMTSADRASVVVFNANGAAVSFQESMLSVGENTVEINTSGLASGIYHVTVIDSRNNSSTQQLVVAH